MTRFLLLIVSILSFNMAQATSLYTQKQLYQKLAQATHIPFEDYEKTASDWRPDTIGLIFLQELDTTNFLEELYECMANDDVKAIVIIFPPKDDVVDGILMQEIERAKTLKPIVAFIEKSCMQKKFVAATAATHVVALPSLLLGGISNYTVLSKKIPSKPTTPDKNDLDTGIEEVYFGGACKHLGTDYYSAEDTNNESFLAVQTVCLAELQNNVNMQYNDMCDRVAHNRNLDRSTHTLWADGKIFLSNEALALQLIDAVGNLTTAIDLAQQLAGITSYHNVTPFEKLTTQLDQCPIIKIANIIIAGTIEDTSDWNEEIVEHVRMAAKDPGIDAVFIGINSPGGDLPATIKLYHEIAEAKKHKPVVVLVGRHCASAGYYLASGAHTIYATGMSEAIGSIGIFKKYHRTDPQNIQEKDPKSGKSYRREITVISAGDHLCEEKPCQASKATHDSMIKRQYLDFISLVAFNRKIDINQSEKWGEGKIFSDQKALQLGLVDYIGGYFDAMSHLLTLVAKNNPERLFDEHTPLVIIDLNSKKKEQSKQAAEKLQN